MLSCTRWATGSLSLAYGDGLLGRKYPVFGETKPHPTSKPCTEIPKRQRRRHGRGSARAPSAGGRQQNAPVRPPGQKAQRRTHGGRDRRPAPFSTQKTENCTDSGAIGQVRHHGRGARRVSVEVPPGSLGSSSLAITCSGALTPARPAAARTSRKPDSTSVPPPPPSAPLAVRRVKPYASYPGARGVTTDAGFRKRARAGRRPRRSPLS
jgi:hypothetical protein